jgi:glyoxylase-like metal-dependent hydrolase (beta-lactamase superfamily II)
MKALAEHDSLLEGMYWIEDAGACSSVYAIESGRTLIDAGNMYGLADELQDLGPLDQLERVLLTHSHFDHVGGLAELYQVASPDLYAHPMVREYLRLLRQPFPDFFEALEKDGKLHLLKDGAVIGGKPSLQVLHLPGHTAGDLGFFDPRSGAFFSGDAVLASRSKYGAALSRPDEVCGGRLQDKLESLRRLLALPVKHLFAGHGEPVFDKGADQIKISLATLYRELEKEHPERAWLCMGRDLLAVGQILEAGQCALKALEIAPDSGEAGQLLSEVTRAGHSNG